MIKKITAFLIVLVMIISLLPVAVFASSATQITVTADKAEAVAGDTITFTVSYGAIEQGLGSSEFSLVIPDGLTYIAGSGETPANLNTTLKCDKAAYTEVPNKKFISYGAEGQGYVSTGTTQILTFKCTVNDNATIGNTTITLNVSDFSDNDFEDIQYNLVPAVVKIAKKPVPATGVTLDRTKLNLKSGENVALVATLAPDGTTDSVQGWKSSNTSVATVDNGKVTALAEGTATITVTTTNNKTATCSVTVTCAHASKTEVLAKDATCTETGNNKYCKCSDCGKIFKADGITETTLEAETIAVLGHDFSVQQSDETHHWTKCSRCDAITEKIQHSGDTWKYDNTDHWKVCGCGVIIEKATHTAGDVKIENEVKATCKAEGSHDEVTYCTVCNKELSRTNKVDLKTAHTPGDAVQENTVPATHTAKGSYDEVVYCSVCEAEISRTKKETDMIPHDGTNVAWESDNTNHWKTCGCGVIIEQEAHTAGEKVNENIVKPTCTEDGKHDEVVYCTICNHEISRTKDVVDKATGHNAGEAVKENVVDSTCSTEGSYDEVVYCTECKAELSRTPKTIEKKAHTPAEPVKENEVESTINSEGSYDEVVYCKDCNKELSREAKTTPKFVYEFLIVEDEHEEGTDGTLTFKANGDFNKFIGIKVDGTLVDKANYSAKSGSTIVTLNSDYLNNLSLGTHKIAFVYDDGEIETNFQIIEKVADAGDTSEDTQNSNSSQVESSENNLAEKKVTKSETVNTGDESNMRLWIIGLIISGILFVIVLKCTAKSQKSKH